MRRGEDGPRTLEEELDDLLNSMSPEQVFEFLFTAAGGAADGEGRRGPRAGEWQYGGDPAPRGGQQESSLWTRYKPLTLLAAVFFFLMLLGGSGVDELRFSLSRTAALGVRRNTPCGVDYYVSHLQKVDARRPREIVALNRAVHREAMNVLHAYCAKERNEYAGLVSLSQAWLSRQSTRDWYARKADVFKRDATACKRAESLIQCTRDQEQHVSSPGRVVN
jgi:hypothetical protein